MTIDDVKERLRVLIAEYQESAEAVSGIATKSAYRNCAADLYELIEELDA